MGGAVACTRKPESPVSCSARNPKPQAAKCLGSKSPVFMQMRLVTIGVGNLVSGHPAADFQGLGLVGVELKYADGLVL